MEPIPPHSASQDDPQRKPTKSREKLEAGAPGGRVMEWSEVRTFVLLSMVRGDRACESDWEMVVVERPGLVKMFPRRVPGSTRFIEGMPLQWGDLTQEQALELLAQGIARHWETHDTARALVKTAIKRLARSRSQTKEEVKLAAAKEGLLLALRDGRQPRRVRFGQANYVKGPDGRPSKLIPPDDLWHDYYVLNLWARAKRAAGDVVLGWAREESLLDWEPDTFSLERVPSLSPGEAFAAKLAAEREHAVRLDAHLVRAAVAAAVARLRPGQRAAIETIREGLSRTEAASKLGITPNAWDNRVHHALRNLRRQLAAYLI